MTLQEKIKEIIGNSRSKSEAAEKIEYYLERTYNMGKLRDKNDNDICQRCGHTISIAGCPCDAD